MALAPIRGAPPGAPNPDFPIEKPTAKPVQSIAAPASADQPPIPAVRQRHTPIEIGGEGVTFTFRVIPEQPAIARASLAVQIVADALESSPSRVLGYLRMSASNARTFLTGLRNDRSPIVATGDEDGDVQIEYESAEAGLVLMTRKLGEPDTFHRWKIDRELDLMTMADELLADLGA